MTLNELFAIQEADVTEEILWNHIRNTKVKREI